MVSFATCDACGLSVRAYVHVQMDAGEITYCGHHADRFEEQIVLQGGKITHDFRYVLRG